MNELHDVAASIWPDGTGTGGGRSGETYVVLPSSDRPRLLVPAGPARASAAVVRYSVEAVGLRSVLRRRVLAAGFRSGVAGRLLRHRLVVTRPDRGLRDHLGRVLGTEVVIGVHLGPPRANRKPVAPVVSPAGALVGFAKLGVNPLTAALVDAETAALGRLAGLDLGPVVVPRVLHHGAWHGRPLLVQSALPVGSPRAAGPTATTAATRAAMLAVARSTGTRTARYPASSYAARLRSAIDRLGASDGMSGRLASVLDAVERAAPELEFGAWHGDWNGTNSAVLADGRVLVWDWERFDDDVPIGFDAVHLALQHVVTRGAVAPRTAASGVLRDAPHLLADFDVPADVASAVAVLYLTELATRYLNDRQAEAGARLGSVGEWLVPAVEEHLALAPSAGARGVT
ncbi:MAG: hypothetical protein NTW05_18405 [Pseudonocardiales bacterium]|nr:hypothetical protein [Pseudonocardiales bacterium]